MGRGMHGAWNWAGNVDFDVAGIRDVGGRRSGPRPPRKSGTLPTSTSTARATGRIGEPTRRRRKSPRTSAWRGIGSKASSPAICVFHSHGGTACAEPGPGGRPGEAGVGIRTGSGTGRTWLGCSSMSRYCGSRAFTLVTVPRLRSRGVPYADGRGSGRPPVGLLLPSPCPLPPSASSARGRTTSRV